MHVVAVGGSDAGISASLRARELDPAAEVTVADAYPNFSICGIPYYVSGEVAAWQNLAHRSLPELEATGMRLRLDTRSGHRHRRTPADGAETGRRRRHLRLRPPHRRHRGGQRPPPHRRPVRPGRARPGDGVHLLHSMGDTLAVMTTLTETAPATAVIVGAGYIGLEMAEALTARGLRVTQIEALDEVLPTVDPPLGALVHHELTRHDVEVLTATTVDRIYRGGPAGRLRIDGYTRHGAPVSRSADLVLVVVGVRPDTQLAVAAGARTGPGGAIVVDEHMRTGLPTFSPPATASSPTTGCSAPPTCHWARLPTNKDGSPGKTPSAAPAASTASSAPKS
jgi:NADPH-dependent 2,4-dienoyl-CoA reductase/sulfur reductase-like enzyme